MKVFASSDYYKRFVSPLCKANSELTAGKSEISRFSNGEIHALVHDGVDHEECLVIGSVAPPDEQLLTLLTLTDALKRSSATRVVAYLPYLGYARQDKFAPGESGGISLIGALLKSAGVDEVITYDTHSDLDGQLLGLPLVSLSPTQLFVPLVKNLGWSDVTVVAPDKGARSRAKTFAEELGSNQPIAYLVKKRVDGILHFNLVGKVTPRVVVVDDILDTGKTLVSACNMLRIEGVQEIIIAVTHGLFTGEAWKRLFGIGVKQLFVSNSCPEAVAQKHPMVQHVPLNSYLPIDSLYVTKNKKQFEIFAI